MLQKKFRYKRVTILLALFFIWIIGFSTITPLERVSDIVNTPLERIDDSHTPSKIDYSALWNRTYGGFDSDRLFDNVLCNDGGYALTGYTQSFDSVDRDTWVIRTDDEGEPLWTAIFDINGTNDYGQSIYQCANGDFVIAGYYLTSGGSNGFVARITDDSDVLWIYEIGLSASVEAFYEVIESSNGAIVAVGNTESWGAGNDDVLVVSLSPVGSPVWTRTYGGVNSDTGASIVESKDGGFAVLGNTLSFGAGFADFWLLRLDTNGNALWNKTYGGGSSDWGNSIIEYVAGGFVMVGETRSFGDPAGDFYVVRVDKDGGLVWDEIYVGAGEDIAYDIIGAARGGFTIVGAVDFIGLNPQTRITRIEPDGTEMWSEFYGGSNVDYGFGIIEARPEEYVVVGASRSYGSGNFDGWMFLVPGVPKLLTYPADLFFEYGGSPYTELQVESTADIDMWWIEDTSVFNIIGSQRSAAVYTLIAPDVGIYDIVVHVNNTAGYEEVHWFFIHVNDWTLPHWTTPPEDQTVEFGELLQYQLHADDLSGLDEWTLTGSSAFVIDPDGEISSTQPPAVGDYVLEISVSDIHSNVLTTSIRVSVQDTIAPHWEETPQDQTIIYGNQFVYDLNASDLSEISAWWVDNPEFSVDWEGRVRNLVSLAPGDHGVTVYVSDIYGNVLNGRFTVAVGSPSTTQPNGGYTPSLLDTAIPFGIGVVATVAVASVVCAMGRRRTPS